VPGSSWCDVLAVQRVRGSGPRDERHSGRAARVLEVCERAGSQPREQVEVAVAVEIAERGGADEQSREQVDSGGERRCFDTSRSLEVERRPGAGGSRQDVEVAVAVEVGDRGRRTRADVLGIEVRRAQLKRRELSGGRCRSQA
jgi:hypothetical protein